MTTIKKNGKAYDSGDAQITMLGSNDSEVAEIEYNYTQEHQNNYYLGSNEPGTWSQGKIEYTGSITMSMRTVVAIEDAMGGDKKIVKVKPFDIVVTYVNEFSKIVKDIITVKFKSWGRTVNGEMGLNQKFDLHVLNVQPNVE